MIPDSDEYDISEEAKDLIFSLIIVPEKRLSFPKIREHPFFKSISWDNLRDQTPPFIPELDSPEDTRYFDLEEDENVTAFWTYFVPVQKSVELLAQQS